MDTADMDLLSQVNRDLIARVCSACCEPGTDSEAYELARLAEALLAEVDRLRAFEARVRWVWARNTPINSRRFIAEMNKALNGSGYPT